MLLFEMIKKDLTTARKAKEKEKVASLTLVNAAMVNKLKEIKAEILEDEDVMKILEKQVKETKDEIESNRTVGRVEKVQELEKRMEIFNSYLPKKLNEGEITDLVQTVIDHNSFTAKDKGALMRVIMPELKGKADGALVNKIVSNLLK